MIVDTIGCWISDEWDDGTENCDCDSFNDTYCSYSAECIRWNHKEIHAKLIESMAFCSRGMFDLLSNAIPNYLSDLHVTEANFAVPCVGTSYNWRWWTYFPCENEFRRNRIQKVAKDEMSVAKFAVWNRLGVGNLKKITETNRKFGFFSPDSNFKWNGFFGLPISMSGGTRNCGTPLRLIAKNCEYTFECTRWKTIKFLALEAICFAERLYFTFIWMW